MPRRSRQWWHVPPVASALHTSPNPAPPVLPASSRSAQRRYLTTGPSEPARGGWPGNRRNQSVRGVRAARVSPRTANEMHRLRPAVPRDAFCSVRSASHVRHEVGRGRGGPPDCGQMARAFKSSLSSQICPPYTGARCCDGQTQRRVSSPAPDRRGIRWSERATPGRKPDDGLPYYGSMIENKGDARQRRKVCKTFIQRFESAPRLQRLRSTSTTTHPNTGPLKSTPGARLRAGQD